MLNAPTHWVLTRLAEAVTPRQRLAIAEWVEVSVKLSAESNSPRPDPISFKGVEYVLALLARLDPAKWTS